MGVIVYLLFHHSNGKKVVIDTKNTYSVQIYVKGNNIPKDKRPNPRGCSGVIGKKGMKTLYEVVVDLQKSAPSWKIKIKGTKKQAVIESILGIKNGEYGKNSKWKIKINKKELKNSIYKTRIKRQDDIEIYYDSK